MEQDKKQGRESNGSRMIPDPLEALLPPKPPVGALMPTAAMAAGPGQAAAPRLPSSQMLPRAGIWGLEKQPPPPFGGESRPLDWRQKEESRRGRRGLS